MIGLLNDKAMNDDGVWITRIDDKPYKVLSYVVPFLEKIEKGSQVEITLNKDDRVSKITRARPQTDARTKTEITREHEAYNARARGTPTDKPGETDIAGDAVEQVKRKAAGFDNPSQSTAKAPEGGIEGIVAATKANAERLRAQEEKKDCTSSMTPAQSGLKTVEGQITSINYEKRGLAVKDKAGDTHPFYWSEIFKMVNYKGEPLQQWWFVRITAELRKSDDTWWVTSQEYFKKPDDWPKPQGGKYGGRQFQPRNEKLIAFLALHRDAVQTYQSTTTPDTQDFEAACALIYDQAKYDVEQAMKDFPGGA
jgi:hypothetical protein